ncbi:MAG: hypothetical protein H5T69_08165 [Chloroflexi bacterium]|nr:hypothetical protein [Chloroflexota bacterium]
MTAKRTACSTTAARAAANRANARRSTGPRTEEGKRRSAANAVRHGILTHPFTLWQDEPGRTAFQKLYAALIEELKPVGVMESLLVERIAIAYWRMRRLARAESLALAALHSRYRRPNDIAHALPEDADLDRFARYHVALERQLERATRELARLQAARHHQESGACPNAVHLSLSDDDCETLENAHLLGEEDVDGLNAVLAAAYTLLEEEDRRLAEETRAEAAKLRQQWTNENLRNEPNYSNTLPDP